MNGQNYVAYLDAVRRPFIKLCRLRFLNPDGSTAFALDNNVMKRWNKTFIASGNINVNLQNGQRRTANIELDNVNDEYSFAYGKMWFGDEVALDEGLVLPDGTEFYIQQGVFLIDSPQEAVQPTGDTASYTLVDKWSNLDGTHTGTLENTYEVPVNTNIFAPISDILSEDRGNGLPIDNVHPIYTDYYNNMTQTLTDGSTASLVRTPYTLTTDGGSSKADVILGLVGMVNGMIGYDPSGALRIEPSQDDIADNTKPVIWRFSQKNSELLGMAYTVNDKDVYNDYIVIGEQLENNAQPMARAENFDPASDTNINIIGRKTYREESSGYGTDRMCKDLAVRKVKRSTVLQKSVSISCSQLLHIQENTVVEIERTDKEGNPVERHLVQGFQRPLTGTGNMTINAVSVLDFPNLKVTTGTGESIFTG